MLFSSSSKLFLRGLFQPRGEKSNILSQEQMGKTSTVCGALEYHASPLIRGPNLSSQSCKALRPSKLAVSPSKIFIPSLFLSTVDCCSTEASGEAGTMFQHCICKSFDPLPRALSKSCAMGYNMPRKSMIMAWMLDHSLSLY